MLFKGIPSEVLPDYDEIVANNELQLYHSTCPVPDLPDKKVAPADQEINKEEERSTGNFFLFILFYFIGFLKLKKIHLFP